MQMTLFYVENLKESIRKKVTKAREILQSCRVQIKTVSKKKKKKTVSDPYLTPYTKTNSKWNNDLCLGAKTVNS